MLQQKGTHVRVSSQKNVISIAEEYSRSDSRCSCPQCDSISCFQIRKYNSGIPCTCADCDPHYCLTWDSNDGCVNKVDATRENAKSLERSTEMNETDSKRDNDRAKVNGNQVNATNENRHIEGSYVENPEVFSKNDIDLGECKCELINNTDKKKKHDLEVSDISSKAKNEEINMDTEYSNVYPDFKEGYFRKRVLGTNTPSNLEKRVILNDIDLGECKCELINNTEKKKKHDLEVCYISSKDKNEEINMDTEYSNVYPDFKEGYFKKRVLGTKSPSNPEKRVILNDIDLGECKCELINNTDKKKKHDLEVCDISFKDKNEEINMDTEYSNVYPDFKEGYFKKRVLGTKSTSNPEKRVILNDIDLGECKCELINNTDKKKKHDLEVCDISFKDKNEEINMDTEYFNVYPDFKEGYFKKRVLGTKSPSNPEKRVILNNIDLGECKCELINNTDKKKKHDLEVSDISSKDKNEEINMDTEYSNVYPDFKEGYFKKRVLGTKSPSNPEKRVILNDKAINIEFITSHIDIKQNQEEFKKLSAQQMKNNDIEHKENIDSEVVESKPNLKKSGISNTGLENINPVSKFTKTKEDKNVNSKNKNIHSLNKMTESQDSCFRRKTVQNKKYISEITNYTVHKQDCKKFGNSKFFGNKSCAYPDVKEKATGIEVQYKQKITSSHNIETIRSPKQVNKNLGTKSFCNTKVVTDDKKPVIPDVNKLQNANENKQFEKPLNIGSDLEIKKTDIKDSEKINAKNQTEKSSKVFKELDQGNKDSHESSKDVNRLKEIINLLDDVKSANDDVNFKYKDVSHTTEKTTRRKHEHSIHEKSCSHLQSIAISYARPDYENSRAELSAQVMNVPYEEFKETLSGKQSSVHSNISSIPNESPKLDIISKIKEIYNKVCSCKVCECFPGKSLFNNKDVCNCKPCDCDDCKSYTSKLRNRFIDVPHSGCPCIACDRKDCRGVVKDVGHRFVCDCAPCNCIKYGESITKPCSCAPCECETCKVSLPMPQALMVGNMTQLYLHSQCDCDPCECQNCTSSYSAMTSNLMREVSTGMMANETCNCRTCPNDSCQLGRSNCRCDSQNEVTRKPLTKSSLDYGIHRVNVNKKTHGKNSILKKNRDTIAMFALSNSYSTKLVNYTSKKDSCQCEVCECIVCKDKGKNLNADNTFINMKLNTKSLNSCNCTLCESAICQKHNLHKENFGKSFFDNCKCSKKSDEIIILNDKDKVIKKANTNYSFSEVNYLRKSWECDDCLLKCFSKEYKDIHETDLVDSEHCHLLRKGKLLMPSMFPNDDYIHDSYQIHKSDDPAHILKAEGSKLNCLFEPQTSFPGVELASLQRQPKSYYIHESPINLIREKETEEIFKNNSVDLVNANESNTFCVYSNNNIQKDVGNALFLDGNRLYTKREGNDVDMTVSSKTHLVHSNQVSEKPSDATNFSNDEVHFSSARNMSLMQFLCKERNINVDSTYTSKYLQSFEKNPLKTQENPSIIEEDVIKYNGLNPEMKANVTNRKSKKFSNIDNHSNSNVLRNRSKPIDDDLINPEIGYHNIPFVNKIKSHLTENYKGDNSNESTIKTKDERNVNNISKESGLNEKVPVVKANKLSDKTKGGNQTLKTEPQKENSHQIKTKRYLEEPNFINTASSVIRFNAFDKFIKFYESFIPKRDFVDTKQNKEENSMDSNVFYVSTETLCTKTSLGLDLQNPVRSISLQTSQESRALNKLQNEINDLLNSPLLQSKHTISQTENSRKRNKAVLETKSEMNDAVSQTQRMKMFVDKELDCDLIPSADNARQNMKYFDNITLTETLKSSDAVDNVDTVVKDEFLERNFDAKAFDVKALERSCDGLKASFVFMRKVSDHTVLLRWTTPRDTQDVQGYELQVDGRPVKKILNPSRCMAVLTCLPDCEKLLLSIRTITTIQTRYNPVNTVVYNTK